MFCFPVTQLTMQGILVEDSSFLSKSDDQGIAAIIIDLVVW